MASTPFSYGTVIASTWLNDVNTAVYNTIPTLAPKISPTLVTPVLGVATATTINKNTFTTPSVGCTWTLANGKTLTVSNTVTLSATDGATLNIGTGGTLGTGAYLNSGGDQLVFQTIAVSGQSSVVADSISDTLTLAAGSGVTITTDATTDTITIASPAAGSTTLLASISVTAVSTIDYLTLFSSAYDRYTIELNGLQTNVTGSLRLQLAVGGVADAASYNSAVPESTTAFTTGLTSHQIAQTPPSGGVAGLVSIISVQNVNSAKYKMITSTTITNPSGSLQRELYTGIFTNPGVVTGFKLSLVTATTFVATGTVRVFGYKNS